MRTSRLFSVACVIVFSASGATATTLVPDFVKDIGLTVRVEEVGTFGPAVWNDNYASPVAIGDFLYIVDQQNHAISIYEDGEMNGVLTTVGLPEGVTPAGANGIANAAGTAGTVYVTFTSSTLPAGFASVAPLPDLDAYGSVRHYELVYAYSQAEDGKLSDPRPLTAFETSTVPGVHRGTGMLALPDGNLLLARGDNLGADLYGLEAPQDPSSTVSKLLIIDGTTGAVEVAAMGLRNVQQLTYTDESRTAVAFSDIGWRVAEEINVIDLERLLDTSEIENFGWGINEDGNAREGTFYVGYDGTGTTERQATALARAPHDEDGFIQPYAQFTRVGDDYTNFFAVSGPVASSVSFSSIGLLFGDLVSGNLYATLLDTTLLDATAALLNDVYHVNVVSDGDVLMSMAEYLGIGRVDLRLFNFEDGSAGFISEKNATMYRLTEVVPVIPLPPGGLLLGSVIAAALVLRRRRHG